MSSLLRTRALIPILRMKNIRTFGSHAKPDGSHAKAALQALVPNKWVEHTQFQKTPMQYISEVPVIEVDGDYAICDGGDPFAGHPTMYIQLNLAKPGVPQTCKYCGLRFSKKHHH